MPVITADARNSLNSFHRTGVDLPGWMYAMRKEARLSQRPSTSLSCLEPNVQILIFVGADPFPFLDGIEPIENFD